MIQEHNLIQKAEYCGFPRLQRNQRHKQRLVNPLSLQHLLRFSSSLLCMCMQRRVRRTPDKENLRGGWREILAFVQWRKRTIHLGMTSLISADIVTT